MSITLFPQIYHDELVYSLLARYNAYGGFLCFKDVAQELFDNPKIKPDREFVKNLKPEVIELLTKNMALEEVLEKHTMYPYYGRFIDSSKRNTAYEALAKMEGDFSKLFGVPQLKHSKHRFFRYCPICAKEDRNRYGETYWHRLHQMRDIHVCSIHGCYLTDSNVILDSKESVQFMTAEEAVPSETEIKVCDNQAELRLAQYNAEVFLYPIDRSIEVSVRAFLHSKLAGTPYISSRGEHNYFHRLWEDLREFYQGIKEIETISDGQVQRLLRGTRNIFFEICAVAMFLGIDAEEVAKMEAPTKSPEQIFDETVRQALAFGMSRKEVARRMGVSSSVVCMSVNIADKSKRKVRRQREGKKLDWEKLDKEYLPLVKRAIEELHGTGSQRPCKISMYAVSKKLNIQSHRLQRMELCRKEIEKSYESREEYMYRKIKWGIDTLERNGEPIKYWRLCQVTKIEKDVLLASLPELEKIAESEVMEQIKAIL